jgi:hypothetical protein
VTDAVPPPPPKKRRKKSTSPTQRTLAECRKRGWIAQVVEQTIPRVFIKRDLFGCIDIVAITPTGIVGIQASAGTRKSGGGGDHATHRTKILAEPRIRAWLAAGARFELWSWSWVLRGKSKAWTLREERFALADFDALAPSTFPVEHAQGATP